MLRKIKNLSWALRVSKSPTPPTKETATLLERAMNWGRGLDLVGLMLTHIKTQNEQIKNLKAQIRFFNDLTARRKSITRNYRKFNELFFKQLRQSLINTATELYRSTHPEIGENLLTSEQADFIEKAVDSEIADSRQLAIQQKNIPF